MAIITFGKGYYYEVQLDSGSESVQSIVANSNRITVTKPAWYIKGGRHYSGENHGRYFAFDSQNPIAMRIFHESDGGWYEGFSEGVFPSQQTNTVPNATTWATLPSSSITLRTVDLFNTTNRSQRTVKLYASVSNVKSVLASSHDEVIIGEVDNLYGAMEVDVTLDAPPDISQYELSGQKDGVWWTEDTAGESNTSIKVDASKILQYGAWAKHSALTLGNVTLEVDDATNILKFPVVGVQAGTYTPTLEVTDTRGQTSTGTLEPIEIRQYYPVECDIELLSNTRGYWVNRTTVEAVVSNIVPPEDYTCTKIALLVGGQNITTQINGTETTVSLKIQLENTGEFTPEVRVYDSRGFYERHYLDPITVGEYAAPTIGSMSLDRTSSRGVAEDDGTFGLITLPINYTALASKLLEPIIELKTDGTSYTPSVTWYSYWDSTNGISNPIDWTSYYNPSSPATIYGLVTGYGEYSKLSTEHSYQITATARDELEQSASVTQILATAFYTIDFLAGGHGIAFGQPSVQDGFECNMDATFHQDLVAQDMTTQEVSDFVSSLNVGGGDEIINLFYPVGSYYETSDTTFNPNTAWGGTWVLEAEGIVHVSAGTSYPVTHANDNAGVGAKDGGESTVTLSLEQIPSHNHGSAGPAFSWNFLAWTGSNPTGKQGENFNLKSPGSGSALGTVYGSFSSAHTHSNNGGGHAHTNMQPYIVVNRWHRTA